MSGTLRSTLYLSDEPRTTDQTLSVLLGEDLLGRGRRLQQCGKCKGPDVAAHLIGVVAARYGTRQQAHDHRQHIARGVAGDGVWSVYRFDGEPPAALLEAEPRLAERIAAMRSYVACRTKFFDDFFREASGAGIRQSVILAAGLDARAWRLDWPADAVLFELDLLTVLAFKAETLDAQGAKARVRHVPVAVDLRDNWPAALAASGFDAGEPVAWIAEGLLPYLPPAAQDLLFERIDSLSVPGSRVAVENFGEGFFDPETLARQRERGQVFRHAAEKIQDQDIPDVAELWYLEERTDAGEFLAGRGWQVTSETTTALLERHGRGIPADLPDATPNSAFLIAQKAG